MTATNITRTVGIEDTEIKVGNGLTLNADAGTLATPSSTLASDLVVSGDASALARTLALASPKAPWTPLPTTVHVGAGRRRRESRKGAIGSASLACAAA